MAIFTAIGAAIAGVGAWIGGLGAVGSFLLKTAVGVGLNLLAQAIAGKPKEPLFSINGTLQSGGDLPRTFILGKTATAGSLVWVNTWGRSGDTPNAYLTQVIALSDLPCQSLDEVWVNGEKVTLLGGSDPKGQPVLEYRKDGKDHLWVKFFDGTQSEGDPFLYTDASNPQRYWSSNRVGRGIAYAAITALGTKNLFSGVPSIKFALTGMRLYDPSKDSTVSGGNGPHRWNDPSTWGGDGDHNPAVQVYNLLRGIYYGGQWFYGLQGVTAARLPSVNWISQINKCRLRDTYRAGGEIPVEAPLSSAIEGLLTACQGRIAEVGGVYNIYVGEPDAAVASFHDDDILSTEEQSFTPFFGLADTINGIAATYPSPADGWGVKAAPPLHRTDLEVLAGNRRLMADVSMDFVPYPEQVQRLMKSALAEGQRARRHTLVLPPKFWPYAVPGAVLAWTSPRNGYVGKLFRVDGAVDRANLDVMIDITEVDPSDYDWDPSTDYKVPVDGAVGVLRPPTMPLVGWQVFPATIGNPGKELPSIRVAYPGQMSGISGVRVAVRLAGEIKPFFSGDIPYGDSATNEVIESTILYGTFAPNTDHEVQGKLIPYGELNTEWSIWLPVTTPDVWISDVYDVDLDMLAKDLAGYQEWVGSGIREIQRRLEEFDLWMADQDFGNEYDRQKIRQQLTAVYEQTSAEWSVAVDVVANENLALVQRVEQLDAEVFDPATGLPAVASAVDALEAYSGPEGTLAQAITSLSASTVPGNVNEANFRMQVVSGPQGYSRIGAEGRQGGEGNWRSAGWYIDVPNNVTLPTRVAIAADQIVFMDGNGEFNPFVFQSGVAYFDSARIRNITADNINVNSLATNSAFVNTLTAQQGFFDHLTLKDGQIPAGIITRSMNASGSGPTGPGSSGPYAQNQFVTLASGVINSHSGLPVLIFANAQGAWQVGGRASEGNRASLTIDLAIVVNGVPVKVFSSTTGYGSSGGGDTTVLTNVGGSDFYYYLPPGPGSVTVAIAARASGSFWSAVGAQSSTNSASIVATCNRF